MTNHSSGLSGQTATLTSFSQAVRTPFRVNFISILSVFVLPTQPRNPFLQIQKSKNSDMPKYAKSDKTRKLKLRKTKLQSYQTLLTCLRYSNRTKLSLIKFRVITRWPRAHFIYSNLKYPYLKFLFDINLRKKIEFSLN